MVLRHVLGAACAALVVGAMSANANAALLGLTVKSPDVFSDTINMFYTVSGSVGTFTATGKAESIDAVSLTSPAAASFQLTVSFTPTGSGSGNAPTINSASLTITGDQGSGVHTLLSYTLLKSFGYSTAHAEFEFVFGTGSGVLDPFHGDIQLKLHGINNVADSDYTNDYFGGNFGSSTGNHLGTSDAWPVPEPASLSMLAIGGVGLLTRRRRRA